MEIIYNGLAEEVPEGASVAEALRALGEPIPHVIVEVNGRYVHREEYEGLRLSRGDLLEVIHPAFGG